MTTVVANGQSIEQFIPLDLRREFYQNSDPKNKYAISNGLDPYGFSTDGLVLYLPLWALKDSSFKSVDAYKNTCNVTGALWQPDGRLFDGADDLITVPDTASIQNIWDGGGTIIFWVNPASDGEANLAQICRKFDTQGWTCFVQAEAAGFMKVSFSSQFDGGGNGLWDTTNAVLPINAFSMVAVTYNADAVGNNPIIYIGDTAGAITTYTVGSGLTEATTPIGTRKSDVGEKLYIGNNATSIRTWDGIESEHIWYGTIKTLAEITHIWETTAWRYQ